MQNSPLLNTHYYDGKLKSYKEKLNEVIKKRIDEKKQNLFSFDESLEQAKKYVMSHATSENQHFALQTLKLFENSKDLNNFDGTNEISVEDIFPILWITLVEISSEITFNGFIEQLADVIRFGSCAQGRVIRLLNFAGGILF
jgi:hypothetical protein